MRFFSSRKIFFSLINSFFFSIWTAKTSLRSVLTTIQISKKKELIAEKKKFLSEKKLRMRALPFQCNAFPATKKIYSLHVDFTVHTAVYCEHLSYSLSCMLDKIVKGIDPFKHKSIPSEKAIYLKWIFKAGRKWLRNDWRGFRLHQNMNDMHILYDKFYEQCNCQNEEDFIKIKANKSKKLSHKLMGKGYLSVTHWLMICQKASY